MAKESGLKKGLKSVRVTKNKYIEELSPIRQNRDAMQCVTLNWSSLRKKTLVSDEI